jgi:hypothetical protein
MQGFGVIGRHGAANGTQHEVTGQQEKEITESQQKAWPLCPADVDQI